MSLNKQQRLIRDDNYSIEDDNYSSCTVNDTVKPKCQNFLPLQLLSSLATAFLCKQSIFFSLNVRPFD